MTEDDCPFCRPEEGRIRLEGEFAPAIPDGFAVTEGHTLVVPRRHVASLFDLHRGGTGGGLADWWPRCVPCSWPR